MKDLIIVCAGGFGKETVSIVESINKVKEEWNILGFIDDTIAPGTIVYHGYKVIGSIKDYIPQTNQYFALGIATPASKEKLYNLLKERGAKFPVLIKASASVEPETIFGEGCVIGNSWIGTEVTLGKCVHVFGSMVGSAEIGDFSTTTAFVNVAAAKIGKRVFVGCHSAILNGRKVGDDAKIGAGSIVINNVKPNTTVFGNPAKRINY